ncbi:MAG: sulfatase, partial [Acidobacteria bacterium]|nr:sulfatase [Acidobacteriota bacterium]
MQELFTPSRDRERAVVHTPLNRRTALRAIGGAVAGFPAILRGQQARRPNVLFVMTDDQRWDAMSCAGNKILKTPNMDRIASGGVRFENAFVTNSLCAPSRATIVTGVYSHLHGVRTNTAASRRLNPDLPTFPGLLQKAGYHTVLVGKWHIATDPTGFDQWCILPGQGIYHDPVMIANGARIRLRGHVEDVIADQALETLRSRPKNQPFCLLYQCKSSHRAWQPAERFANAFENVNIPEPKLFDVGLEGRPQSIRHTDMQIADMPDFRQRGVPPDWPTDVRKRMNFQTFMKNYYRVLLSVDENLGRVLDYLDQQRLAENTIVIYTSDNGFFAGEYGMFDKRLMYEPSIRVPMLVRYPAAVKPGQVDKDHMVLNNDVAHTVLDYCGIERPQVMRNHGESWRPVLEGRPAEWRKSWLYEYFELPGPHCAPQQRGVRTSRYKLISYIQQPQEYEFFDLEKDPEEQRSVHGDPAYRNQVAELKIELERLRDLTKDDRSEDGVKPGAC